MKAEIERAQELLANWCFDSNVEDVQSQVRQEFIDLIAVALAEARRAQIRRDAEIVTGSHGPDAIDREFIAGRILAQLEEE